MASDPVLLEDVGLTAEPECRPVRSDQSLPAGDGSVGGDELKDPDASGTSSMGDGSVGDGSTGDYSDTSYHSRGSDGGDSGCQRA